MTPTTFRRVDGESYRRWWSETYGGPADVLASFAFFQRGGKTVWVAARGVELRGLDPVDAVGIPFVRMESRVWKPTSVAALAFGSAATRNVVELQDNEMRAFLGRETVELGDDDRRRELPNRGFVIVRYRGVPLGCGQWRPDAVVSCVPKGRMITVLDG